MTVMSEIGRSWSRNTLVLIFCAALASSVFARNKHHHAAGQSLSATNQMSALDAALTSNDLDTAESLAADIYQQATNAPALQSSDPSVIIDPALASASTDFLERKAACLIGECYYRHAQLDVAGQWAATAATGGALSNQYVRRATVLLGDTARAMDQDGAAVTNYMSVISFPGPNHEQCAAYAGLLEVFMLENQTNSIGPLVQQGQANFAGSADLELAFLKQAAAILKRRNNPLWNQLDQQIAGLTSAGEVGHLKALHELASNARKFGRWAEAETNYAAICALPLNPEDTVNNSLFLADSQAQQGEDFTATLQQLQQNSATFSNALDREYATYRTAKFYDDQGISDLAATNYQLLTSSASTSTWAAAALHQFGALEEKQGNLQGALQLYLQYPISFPQSDRLVMQSYNSALNVADTLGDSNTASFVLGAITNRAAAIQDYNVYLNLAFHYKKYGHPDLAAQFLTNGVVLARQALQSTTDPHARYVIHARVLRRIADFNQSQQTLAYFKTYAADFPATESAPDDDAYLCYWYKAFALAETANVPAALETLQWLMDEETGHPQLQARTAESLGIFYGWQSGTTNTAPIFEAVVRQYPTHPWANAARLNLAVRKFNSGDYSGAQMLVDQITNTLTENSKMVWIRDIYWGAVYLRGRCIQAQGNVSDGNNLQQLALSKVPRLSIRHRLNAQ